MSTFSQAWAQLTGYVTEARDDGDGLDPAQLLSYMTELRGEVLATALTEAFPPAPVGGQAEPSDARHQTQTIAASAEGPVWGNCIQAAIASFVGLPLDAVPHFLTFTDWAGALEQWLAERGLIRTIEYTTAVPADRCLVFGRSSRGYGHICIGENGTVEWDPHPSREGLTEVTAVWRIAAAAVSGEQR